MITDKKRQELEERMGNCNLLENDIEEKFVRSGGAGGQKVNKSSTCVHLKHIPSGLAVKVQKSRSQGLNRYYARRINYWEKKARPRQGSALRCDKKE